MAFASRATDLAPGDYTRSFFSVFVRDMLLGETRLVSVNRTGTAAADFIEGRLGSYNATISADGGTVAFVSDADDLIANDRNLAIDVFAVNLPTTSPWADLSLTITSTPNPPVPGSNVTFTLVVTNHGPITATNVVLTHSFPTNAPFISATVSQGTFTRTNGTIFAQLGSITFGQHATVTVVLTVPANPNTLFSVANVTAYQPDLNLANNYSAVSTIAGNGPVLPPLLTITRVGGQLEVSWPDSSTGFALQQRSALNPASPWQAATNIVTQSGGRFRAVVAPMAAAQFFRLARESGGTVPQPTIAFVRLGNQLELSWPDSSSGFAVQQTTNLALPIVWSPSTNSITQSGGRFRVTVNIGAGQRFFRLTAP